MQVNVKDAASGVIFLVIAAWFAIGTTDLTIGTPLRMGPGFFPLMLAAILALLGVIILVQAFGHTSAPMKAVPWRGAFLILGAPIVFGMTVRGFPPLGIPALGLVPSVALTVLLASWASRKMTVGLSIILTVLLTVFCLAVFQRALGLPVPPFGGPLEWLNPYVDAMFAPIAALFRGIGAVLSGIVHFVRSLFVG